MNGGSTVDRRGWWSRHKATVIICSSFAALGLSFAAIVGLLQTRSDQAELRAADAQALADRAEIRAIQAIREQYLTCLSRQQAQDDVNEILLTIAATLPPTTGNRLRALIDARPPIICEEPR